MLFRACLLLTLVTLTLGYNIITYKKFPPLQRSSLPDDNEDFWMAVRNYLERERSFPNHDDDYEENPLNIYPKPASRIGFKFPAPTMPYCFGCSKVLKGRTIYPSSLCTMGIYRTCVLFVTLNLLSSLTALEVDKTSTETDQRDPTDVLRGKRQDVEFYKRKPQFFVGVKGKKLYDLETPEFFYKRAPMGFMGMRGKKTVDDFGYEEPKSGSLIGQIDYTSGESNEEFPFLDELLQRYLEKADPTAMSESQEGEAERITNEIDKRAATIHQFFGVRGKKSMQKRLSDVSFRGKFIGVRGKKDMRGSGAQEIRFLLPFPKRKGQVGFIGMRGKK